MSNAIGAVSVLPEKDQNEIALEMIDLAAHKRIEAMLLQSEMTGGKTSSDEFFMELKSRYAG